MKRAASILIYLGSDQHFANNLKQAHQEKDIGFIHLESGTEFSKLIEEEPTCLLSSYLLIDSDLKPFSGLSFALYIAEKHIEHLGTMILSENDLGHEVAVLSDYFIEACGCFLLSGNKQQWSMIYS